VLLLRRVKATLEVTLYARNDDIYPWAAPTMILWADLRFRTSLLYSHGFLRHCAWWWQSWMLCRI